MWPLNTWPLVTLILVRQKIQLANFPLLRFQSKTELHVEAALS